MLSRQIGGTTAELPPRARRILNVWGQNLKVRGTTSACAENTEGGIQYRGPLGTTSACAENTIQTCILSIPRWNYLRVRGEYWGLGISESEAKELPPRARRIHAI